MTQLPVIEVQNLCKTYQVGGEKVAAVDQVSLTIKRGEFVAIMGPSGSGKSTFMYLIGCLDTPTSGRVLIDGEDAADLTEEALADIRNRKIGFVFQQFNLLGRVSAEDNVAVPLLYSHHRRLTASNRAQLAESALHRVNLSDRAAHTPAQLSGGQQQRVAIARALVSEPLVLLADEPTGALDSRTGQEILTLFRQLNQEGITIILVTHDAQVAQHADRVITFHDGRVLSDQPAGALAEAAP